MLEIGETFLCFLKTASSYFNHFNVMEHLLLNVQNIQSGTQISVLLMKINDSSNEQGCLLPNQGKIRELCFA